MRTLIIATFAAALSLVVNVSATEARHGYGMHGHHGHHLRLGPPSRPPLWLAPWPPLRLAPPPPALSLLRQDSAPRFQRR